MPTITNLFNIAQSALLAHQQAMNVVGHNIANVGTEGYSRQKAVYSTNKPYYDARGIFGSGVSIESVQRYKADYIDKKITQENSSRNQWDVLKQGIDEIEQLFTGLGERDLATNLTRFFDAWDSLSVNAYSSEYRQALVDTAVLLVNQLNEMGSTLTDHYSDISSNITSAVDQVNDYAAEIAELNGMIKSMETESDSSESNDLRDRRQVLINKLSRLVNLSYTVASDGMVSITVEGKMLVAGTENYDMSARSSMTDYGVRTSIYLSSNESELEISSGEIGGYLTLRDDKIKGYLDSLNSITRALVENVNREHSSGFNLDSETGIDFFDPEGLTAATISINNSILDDPAKIAVSAGEDTDGDGVPDSVSYLGDSSVALRISNLRNLRVFDQNNILDKIYSLYSDVGFDGQESSYNLESHDVMLQQLENSRQSKVGVSIDEEMADLMQLQNSYAAAAKLMEMVGSMMETLLAMVG